MRNLRRRPDREDASGWIEHRNDAAALHGYAGLPLIAVGPPDDMRRRGPRRFQIATLAGLLDKEVIAPAFKQQWCVCRRGGFDIGDNRQRIILNEDRFSGVLDCIGIFEQHRTDRLANEADAFTREDRLGTPLHARQVRGSADAEFTDVRARKNVRGGKALLQKRRVDARDPGMCEF
jgi:hypothetical protein